MFWVGVVVNYLGFIAYLIFVAMGMNIEFVFRDPAKLWMHLVLVPFAMWLLIGVYVALNLDSWQPAPRKAGCAVAFLIPVLFASFAIGKGIQDFQYPNADRMAAAYPSDYFKPWRPPQVAASDRKVTSLGAAAKDLYLAKRDAGAYAMGLKNLKVIEGDHKRDIRFLSDAGPAGYLGPGLTALAAAAGGFTVAAAALAFLALYFRYPLGIPKPYPKILASFLVLLVGFLPMQWLTSKLMWSQTPCCEPINPAIVVLVVIAVVIFAPFALFIYLQIRYSQWVRRISALVLGVVVLFPAGTGDWLIEKWPLFAKFVEALKDDPIIALGVSAAITIVVMLCSALVISPRPPAKPPKAKDSGDSKGN